MKNKNSKTRRKSIANIAIMAIFILMLSTNFSTVLAVTAGNDFEIEELNNKAINENGVQYNRVTGVTATSSISIDMTAEGETAHLYKLATIDYVNGEYTNLVWVDNVIDWLEAQEAYTTSQGAIISAYSTPEALGKASQATWDAFYRDLLYKNSENNIIDYDDEEIRLTQIAEKTVEDPSELTLGFSSVEMGIYAIVATSSIITTKAYNPVIVEVIPDKKGPGNDYYIQPNYHTSLKASGATIKKYINGHASDAVHYGELVDFTVDVTLPSLYADRVTLTASGDAQYKLEITDTMSKAFALYDANEDDELDVEDFAYTYIDPTTELPTQFTNAEIDYWAIANQSYKVRYLDEDNDIFYLKLTDNDTDVLAAEPVRGSEVYYEELFPELDWSSLGSGDFYAVKRNDPLYTISVTEPTGEATDTVITMNINIAVLKQMVADYEDGTVDFSNSVSTLHYKASVTDKIEIASENNYNRVHIAYEGGTAEDTVRGYTYGVQVVKVDGNTLGVEGEDPEYLANAQFKIFKEIATYVDTSETSTPVFTLMARNDGKKVSGLTTPLPFEKTYEEMKAEFDANPTTSNYYVYETSYDTDGETDLGIGYEADQLVGRVFEVYTSAFIDLEGYYAAEEAHTFAGEFRSIKSEKGITIKGVDEGNFVLMETKAPVGYNGLAEDVLFSIVQIDENEAKLSYNNSLAAFYDGDKEDANTTLVESGIMSLQILNYRGLTLPSTGGKGILLFTVLGIALMASSMIIIIAKQKQKDASFYMM